MYLADYHIRTGFSPDSSGLLLEQAAGMGLKEICIAEPFEAAGTDPVPILDRYAALSAACEGRLRLRLGLEVFVAESDPERVSAALSALPLDVIIGSGERDCTPEEYFASLRCLVKMQGCFDVLGHVLRPLNHVGGEELEQLREIFIQAAETGLGLELNTDCGRTLNQWLPVLKLYRDCGGEIVTIGSDACEPSGVGKGIARGHELLKEAGFRYQAICQKRRPQFKKL